MEINTLYFLSAFGIGLSVELLLQGNPDIYRKSIYIGKALLVAGAIALMPSMIIRLVFYGFLLAKAGDLVGGYLLKFVLWVAVKVEARKWDTHQDQTNSKETNSKPTSDGS